VDYPEERDATIDAVRIVGGNGYVPPGYRVVHVDGGTAVVEILGEHDLATRDTIRDLFLRLVEANTLVVVDLSDATFVDSSFLSALVTAHKHAGEVGSRLRLQVGTTPIVRKVLEISGLNEYLDCVDGRAEAVR
jgi:anti-anti-sigma factor